MRGHDGERSDTASGSGRCGGTGGFDAAAPSTAPYRSAIELRDDLVARKVSARELSDAAIARIEALDGKIKRRRRARFRARPRCGKPQPVE